MTATTIKLHHTLIIAGFGGQGVLKLGQTLAEASMHEGREVIWTPAYGPEMRGGPSFCTVIISSDPIGAPVADQVNSAIIMDQPSLAKYQQQVRPGGKLIFNSSLVAPGTLREDITYYAIPANAIAEELGDQRTGNMVLLGALLHLTHLAAAQTVLDALEQSLPERHRHLLPLNARALAIGAERIERISPMSA